MRPIPSVLARAKRRTILLLLTPLACALTLTAYTLPAQASPLPAPTSSSSAQLGAATHDTITSYVSPATPAPRVARTAVSAATAVSPATTYCKTAWAQENELDGFGITLYSFRLTTNWCYNGATVTSHSSSISHNVSGTGQATGWSYDSSSQSLSFNCYSANGRSCSGNHELAQGNFDAILGVCIAQVSEDETYNGGFSYSGQAC